MLRIRYRLDTYGCFVLALLFGGFGGAVLFGSALEPDACWLSVGLAGLTLFLLRSLTL